MDFTDIQQDYHNNVQLIFMSREDDQYFRQQKSQLFWKKIDLNEKSPRSLLNAKGHDSGQKGVLRLHMSAWDMRGCDNLPEKKGRDGIRVKRRVIPRPSFPINHLPALIFQVFADTFILMPTARQHILKLISDQLSL